VHPGRTHHVCSACCYLQCPGRPGERADHFGCLTCSSFLMFSISACVASSQQSILCAVWTPFTIAMYAAGLLFCCEELRNPDTSEQLKVYSMSENTVLVVNGLYASWPYECAEAKHASICSRVHFTLAINVGWSLHVCICNVLKRRSCKTPLCMVHSRRAK